ncbi:MAG: autotransporter-associated beta strand repeat-containing protein [Limisphaerales bacterium]
MVLTAWAQNEPPARPPMPVLKVKQGIQGEAAIAALGDKLAEVAAHYGKGTNELRALLRRDRSLHLDERANLFYACEGLVAPPNAATNENNSPVTPLIAPLSQTFFLHSRPGSSKVIYLDFNGHTLSGNAWTANNNGGADIVAPPWSIDLPATFNTTEQTTIQQVWYRVAEDYAAFDVDVTTEYPGEAAITRSNSGDTQYGTRALISAISSYFGNYGGIAYLNAFDGIGDFNKPALIFPENLGNSAKNIAEAVSHEVGHNFGLSHDGTTTGVEYYAGQGNWAPIMGVGYDEPISQWSKGEYANANNTEDDLTIITSHGVTYRTNDFGNSMGTATPLTGFAITTNGIISRGTDVDYFSFVASAGASQFSIVPWELGADLHLKVSLYNSGGVLLTNVETADDATGTRTVSFASMLTSGLNYIAIEGTGTGNPLTTGYSDYASLGQYTLNITLPSAGSWLPTPAGNYSWTNAANWASGTVPTTPDIKATIKNAILGNQILTLDTPVSVGQLLLGTTVSANAFTIQNGAGGPLTFDVTTGSALLLKSGDGADEISAAIALADSLVVSNSLPAAFKLSGPVSGAGGLTKIGAGRLLLSGTNTFSGSLVVSNGTLELDPAALLATPLLDVRTGTLLEAVSGYTVVSGQTLAGSGAVTGAVTIAGSGALAPGNLGAAGTLTFSNSLTLGGGANWKVDLAEITVPGGNTNDLAMIAGDLLLAGTNTITVNVLGAGLVSPGVYTIATYGGALAGGDTNLVVISAARYSITADTTTPGEVRLIVSGSPVNLTWHGDGAGNVWNVAGTANWFNGAGSDQFFQLDTVLFDDTGSNTTPVSLSGTLAPTLLTVSANKNFIFTGSGKISGTTALVKSGASTLTISNANDFTGPTILNGGQLKLANASALGIAAGTVFVTNTGVLELNGQSLGAKPLVASATILNNGAPQTNALRFVTLTGDTTLGGSGRLDVRPNPTASLTGNGYKLTKTGANELWLAGLGDTALGDIEVQQGLLGLEGSTLLGNPASVLSVGSGAALRLSIAGNSTLNKVLNLAAAIVSVDTGTNTATGAVTMTGSNNLPISTSFTMSGSISGSGSINKSGAGVLILSGSNSYTGTFYVDSGTATTNDGVVRLANSQAVQNFASPIYIRNTASGASTLQLSAGVVATQTVQLSGRNTNVAAIQNVSGSNTLAGGFVLQAGGSNYWFQSDSGTLALDGQIPISQPAAARMFRFSGAGNHVVNGTLQNGAGGGSIGIVKTNLGTLKLNGTNTYSRFTLLSQGLIDVNSSFAFGTGAVTNDTGTNTGRILLENGVTVTNAIVVKTANAGANLGVLTVNGNVSATFSGPVAFSTNPVAGGHIAGPASGNPLQFNGPITLPGGVPLVVQSGNVRFSGGGSYSEIQQRSGTASLGAPNGIATGAVLDLAGSGTVGTPTVLDLNGYNQSLAGLKNLIASNNAAWVSNSVATTNILTLSLGASNYYFGGSIGGSVALTLNSGTQMLTRSGATMLNGAYNYFGNTTLNGGKLVLGSGIAITNTPVIAIGAGAILDATASPVTLAAPQILAGNGTLLGNLSVNGVVSPGASAGKLTCSSNVTFNGGGRALMEISKSPLTNDLLQVNGTLTYGGTLTVTNLAGALAVGDSFKLFNAAFYAGNFTATNLPPLSAGQGWQFTPANGTLSVVQAVATNPTGIEFAIVNNTLQLSWPADHLGWTLEMQTNSLAAGLGTNWVTIPETSATNNFSVPINYDADVVFYRLRFP